MDGSNCDSHAPISRVINTGDWRVSVRRCRSGIEDTRAKRRRPGDVDERDLDGGSPSAHGLAIDSGRGTGSLQRVGFAAWAAAARPRLPRVRLHPVERDGRHTRAHRIRRSVGPGCRLDFDFDFDFDFDLDLDLDIDLDIDIDIDLDIHPRWENSKTVPA
jgi:hypothetical protein